MRVNIFSKKEIVHEMNTSIKQENLDIPAFTEKSSSLVIEKAFPILKGETVHYDGSSFSKGYKTATLSKEAKSKELYLILGM